MINRGTMSLRILVAHQVSNSRNGGMSRIMGFTHDYLVNKGHSVEYLCAEALSLHWPHRPARFTFPWLVRQCAVTAAREGRPYNLINVHEPSSAAITLSKVAAGNPVVVVTSHGVEQRSWEQALAERRLGYGGPKLRTRVMYPLTSLWQSRLGLRRADHIFCLNFEDRDYLVNRLGCLREQITRIYPGADTMYAQAAQNRDYTRCKRLLFAGGWIKRKGIKEVIQAFTVLAARHPELTLTVLGGGVPEHIVRADFPESLHERVQYVQPANEADSAAACAQADVYLLPSHFEGTPLTLMEAMMSGLPIVTTATCGMKDIIRDGENGRLVPLYSPGDIVAAVEQLIGDPDYCAQLGRKAQAEALNRYTWERASVLVGDVYGRLCAQRKQ
jgi:glycosyltransferase involved in cell wall biosynthesis